MSVKENILSITQNLPDTVKLVAVSKTKPVGLLLDAYEAGQRIFGENKVQELTQKHSELPNDIQWHYIGHLQSNKVKYIAHFVDLIHAIDSIKLLNTIEKEAYKNNRIIYGLLQVKIADEETKFGIHPAEIESFMHDYQCNNYENVKLCGVMGMATYTNNTDQVRREFKLLKEIYIRLKQNYFADSDKFCEISMGMSHDYTIAIEEGATLIRIGTTIFGDRNYNQPE